MGPKKTPETCKKNIEKGENQMENLNNKQKEAVKTTGNLSRSIEKKGTEKMERINKKHSVTKTDTEIIIEDTETKNKRIIKRVTPFDGRELLNMNLPEPYFAVEGLFSEGANIIAAPPKTGKSWLALEMCIAVARGEDFLGFRTTQSDVLYLDLEEPLRYGQERIQKVLAGREMPKEFKIMFDQNLEMINSGFMEQLEDIVLSNPQIRLVVIDTAAKIMGRQKKNSMTAYSDDYEVYSRLKIFGAEYHIAIVIITHTTKMMHPDDPLANVMGTNGVIGSVDNIIVLKKERRQGREAVLYKDGKCIRQGEYDIVFDEATFQWHMVGPHDADFERSKEQADYLESPIRAVIRKKLAEEPVIECKASEILDWSEAYGERLLCSAKEIGGFLHKHLTMFRQDGLRVEIIKNGTGSSRYRIIKPDAVWQDAADEIPFE